jgi:hypothetical protein
VTDTTENPTKLTITEALAEIATIVKRLAKRRELILPYLARQRMVADPLAERIDGGSPEFIRRERQAVRDLEARLVRLRTTVQAANVRETLTVDGDTRTLAEWLTWRREIQPGQASFLMTLRAKLEAVRREAAQKQVGLVNVAVQDQAKYADILVNLDEVSLAAEADHMEQVMGALDGALNLKNATTFIDVA